MRGDTNVAKDDDEEEDDGNYSFLCFFINFTSFTMKLLCYSIDDQDLEVEMAQLNDLIGKKDAKIRELQGQLWFEGGNYTSLYQDLQVVNKEIRNLYKQLH